MFSDDVTARSTDDTVGQLISKIAVGSVCLLQGLVSKPELNGLRCEVDCLPMVPEDGGRLTVILIEGATKLRVKPENVVLCCAQAECFKTTRGESGSKKQLLQCGGCLAHFYCSESCQKEAWKSGHKPQCKTIVQARERSAAAESLPPPSSAPYQLIDMGLEPGYELHRLKHRFVVETNYYMTMLKDLLRDDLVNLQNRVKNAMMNGQEYKPHSDRLLQELGRQFHWCTTVEPIDSAPMLAFKVVVQDILKPILQSMPADARARGLIFSTQLERTFQAASKQVVAEFNRYMDALVEVVKAKHPDVADISPQFLKRTYPLENKDETTSKLKANPKVNRAPWFPGPSPLVWDHSWDLLKMRLDPNVVRTVAFWERSYALPTRKNGQKKMDFHLRFYKYNYPKGAWSQHENVVMERTPSTPLPYWQHVQLHTQANAHVQPLAGCPKPPDETLMPMEQFIKICKIDYPNLQICKCDTCGVPTLGECLCGEAYCSQACFDKDWNSHERVCTQVLDNSIAFCLFVPLSHGRKNHDRKNHDIFKK